MRTLQAQIREYAAVVELPDEPQDIDWLFAISGAAFRSYHFHADDNYNWATVNPEIDMRADALQVENYGAFESLRAHLGWARRRWQIARLRDAVALIRSETSAGRQVLRYLGPRTQQIVGLEFDGYDVVLDVIEGGTQRRETVGNLTRPDDFVAALGDLITVRPEPVDRSPRREAALLRDLLLWIPRHHFCVKEIAYDRDVYFAAGRRATLLFAERLLESTTDEEASARAAHERHVRAWLEEFSEGRGATLSFWSDERVVRFLDETQQQAVTEQLPIIERALSSLVEASKDPQSIRATATRALIAGSLTDIVSAEDAIAEQLRPGLSDLAVP